MIMLLKIVTFFLPWPLRRWALNKWFGFEIHSTAKIGLSWIFPGKLVMGQNCRISHFTVAIHLDLIHMSDYSTIGRSNWITGLSTRSKLPHFSHQANRYAELIIGRSTNITRNHHLDCTDRIAIGSFSTIAGYQSQFLTHSINLFENRQDSAPISIGAYTFVGTNVVILGGSALPPYSVLGAKSLLNKSFTEEFTLYGGVPAKAISEISKGAKYFQRTDGFVV